MAFLTGQSAGVSWPLAGCPRGLFFRVPVAQRSAKTPEIPRDLGIGFLGRSQVVHGEKRGSREFIAPLSARPCAPMAARSGPRCAPGKRRGELSVRLAAGRFGVAGWRPAP